jgi:NADPH2:quinone reductase
MTMRAVRVHSYGAPEVLQLGEYEIPVPKAGEVLVEVTVAAVSFYDICNRRGDFADRNYYKEAAVLPLSPGYQGGGVVAAVGGDVTSVGVGDRVAWLGGSGSYATHMTIPAAFLIPVPDDIDLEQVAGCVVQGLVAYKVTHEAYPVQPGEWCLVQAAAGGVGSLICQLAKLRGAKVIGVTSSEQKVPIAHQAGADEVLLSTRDDLAAEVKRITGGGVRVVYDGVGKDAFDMNLDSLAPRGYLVIYGQTSGFVPPFDLMTLQDKGGLYLTRWVLQHYVSAWPDQDYVDKLFGWMRSGELVVHIDRRLPLDKAVEAHAAVEGRQTAGRVMLVP